MLSNVEITVQEVPYEAFEHEILCSVEVRAAVIMNSTGFWGVTLCSSERSRRFDTIVKG
jgi:hypothetical protein